MTTQQRDLVISCLLGWSLFGLFIVFLSNWGSNKKLAVLVFLVLAYSVKFIEKNLKPARPMHAPTPGKLVEENRTFKLLLGAALFGVAIAGFASVAYCNCTDVLMQFRWIFVAIVLAPVAFILIYSEFLFYKALAAS